MPKKNILFEIQYYSFVMLNMKYQLDNKFTLNLMKKKTRLNH